MTMKNFELVLSGISIWLLGIFGLPTAVHAQANVVLDLKAEDLTSGSGYQNPLSANPGDRIRFKGVMVDNGGESASGVTVRMPLFNSVATVQYPSFHILSMNAPPPDAAVVLNLSGSAEINYIPGTTTITKAGANVPVSTDTASANITNQQIPVGNVGIGTGNQLVVIYEAMLQPVGSGGGPNNVITPTPTPAAALTTVSVASTSPRTGMKDPVAWKTVGYLGLLVTGISIRKWTLRFLE